MMYCSIFDEIKATLEDCNRNVQPFNKILFRSGNEFFINEVATRLRKILVSNNLMEENVDHLLISSDDNYEDLRKVTMFLLVNTDATYKYDLKAVDAEYSHIVGICPLMPKFLFVTLMWECQMDQFLYEFLSSAPIWLSYQHFETAADSLKYFHDQFNVLTAVDKLISALFMGISESFVADEVERKIIFRKLYNYGMELLRQFHTPDSRKISNVKRCQQKRYTGIALRHLMGMTIFGMNIYEENKALNYKQSNMNIYMLNKASIASPTSPLALPSENKSQIQMLIMALMNAMQNNLMCVDIDTFLYWLELESTPVLDLQTEIGEKAHELITRMSENTAFEHNLVQQLKMFAKQPKSVEERAAEVKLGALLRMIDYPAIDLKDKKIYFSEIFNRDLAYGNEECLQTMRNNVKLMTPKNCKQILEYIKMEVDSIANVVNEEINKEIENITNEVKTDIQMAKNSVANCEQVELDTEPGELNTDAEFAFTNDYPEPMEVDDYDDDLDGDGDGDCDGDCNDYSVLCEIIINAFATFDEKQILEVLAYRATIFGSEEPPVSFENSEFLLRSTLYWNSFSVESFKLKEFLLLCFENPIMMWQKYLDLALHTENYAKHYVKIILVTAPFSNKFHLLTLNELLDNDDEVSQRLVPFLLCEIYMRVYYPNNIELFLRTIIFKYITKYAQTQNFEALQQFVKALSLINSYGETSKNKPLNFGDRTSPLLIMIAKLLENARWDLLNYSDSRYELVVLITRFLQRCLKRYLPVAPIKNRQWITHAINKENEFRPLTKYYFQKFAQNPDEMIPFGEFVIPQILGQTPDIDMIFAATFVRCTTKEMEWLLRNDLLRRQLHKGMYCIASVVKHINTAKALDNYQHCYLNYCTLVEKILLSKCDGDTKKVLKIVCKVLTTCQASPPELYASLLMETALLIERILEDPIFLDVQFRKSLTEAVEQMEDCAGKENLLEKLKIPE